MRKIGEAKRIKNTKTRKHRAINNWRLIIKTPCFRVSVFNFIKSSTLYSHSIVEGGLELMSYTTRLTPFTLLIISLETLAKNS